MSSPHDIDEWKPWSPAELAGRLCAIATPWYVAGGWALDLWHGRETRWHEDLEFVVLRDDLPVFLPVLSEFDMYTAHDGVLTPLPPGRLPEQKIFQIWCWERAGFMLARGHDDRERHAGQMGLQARSGNQLPARRCDPHITGRNPLSRSRRGAAVQGKIPAREG